MLSLDVGDRKTGGGDIATVEFGMPVCRPLGGDLWEVRSRISARRIACTIFVLSNGELILLHGFIKKTQKTPKPDRELAHARRKDIAGE